jgi:hydroxymethylbilane synthase
MAVMFRVATRRSALALAQTRWVIEQYRSMNSWFAYMENQIVTEGDRVQDRPLYEVGGKGLFVKELERALLDEEAEIAVHSMKDLPGTLAPGLAVMAVPPRESPWDLLLTRDKRSLSELPKNARVGTTSLRRQLQLREARSDLEFIPLRGNIDTRLRRLEAGDFDAIVLAEAGVRRLGLTVKAVSLERVLVPAIGQGALAIEGSPSLLASGNPPIDAFVRSLDHADTHLETNAERAVQRALGADCVTPVGAHAQIDHADRILEIAGFLASNDGKRCVRARVAGGVHEHEKLGQALAEELRRALDAS